VVTNNGLKHVEWRKDIVPFGGEKI